MNGQQLEQSMRELEIHLEGRPVYCMVIKVGEVYRFEEATAEEIQTLRISVVNITEEIVSDVCCGYCFSGRTGEFDVLLTGAGAGAGRGGSAAGEEAGAKCCMNIWSSRVRCWSAAACSPGWRPASRRHSGGANAAVSQAVLCIA